MKRIASQYDNDSTTSMSIGVLYRDYLKRLADVVVSFISLIILLPLLVCIALAIPLESKGPIFFAQERVGRNLSSIQILKFRTMTHQARNVGNTPLIGRADGVTALGYYLRRFKIDEIPQLINVLIGEMSLVGPRPSVPEHLDSMSEQEKRRYSVRPGLTGLAQVSGNIHLPWEERFRCDIEYIKKITALNDLRILWRTVMLIFRGEEYYKDRPLRLG